VSFKCKLDIVCLGGTDDEMPGLKVMVKELTIFSEKKTIISLAKL
jgi:hypothetical protein